MNAKSKYMSALSLVVAMASMPQASFAQLGQNLIPVSGIGCNGSACGDIQWLHDSFAMYAKNTGSRPVHIHWNNVDVVLEPGQTHGGFGLAIEGKATASYVAVNGPPERFHPIEGDPPFKKDH